MKTRVYISGRMSGRSEGEIRDSFSMAEIILKERGYKVFNPARWRWFLKCLPYNLALAFDIFMMCFCDRIYLLDGWLMSDGACTEHAFAKATGIVIMYER